MREIERSAASVEEAVEAALADLGVSEQEAEIEVVQEPRSGFLGMKSQPAVVRVRAIHGELDVEEATSDAEDQAEAAADFLEGLLDVMGIEAELEIGETRGNTYVDIWAPEEGDSELALLIGKRGHTLTALQEITRVHVQKSFGEPCAVLVDVEDYRKRHEAQLTRLARDAARRVQRTGRTESLEPMNSYDRKLVHDTVASIGGLETSSEGEEPNRFVSIRKVGR